MHTELLGLFIAAVVIALIARRLALPYTVGLVFGGVALALLNLRPAVPLTHDLIFDILLPPLLFEASLQLRWSELRAELPGVALLATLGVVIAAAVVTGGLVWGLGWPIKPALVFGVLISATDPVAVIALFKDLGLGGRLRLVMEAESLANDGVAAVLFGLVLGWAVAPAATLPGPGEIGLGVAISGGGGTLAGVAVGFAAIGIAGRTEDHMVETALTAVAAYGAFYLAESLHLSGVLACVAAGVVMGNLGCLAEENPRFTEAGRHAVEVFWEFAAFLANSVVFLLIGLAVAEVSLGRLGLGVVASVVGLVLLSRALTVYPLCLFLRSVTVREQHVLVWGGLRGALGLALALALPPEMPMRAEILVATFSVVTFSVVVEGLTMKPLLHALRVA